MKFNFNLFGGEVTYVRSGYSISISAESEIFEDNPYEVAWTYWGARFLGWRRARMYAKQEGRTQNIVFYKGLPEEGLIVDWRQLPVRNKKVVKFFTK